MGALVKDTEAIEAVDGLGHDERIDGIFGHPPWSLIPRGSTGISSLLRHARRNPEPEWGQWLGTSQFNEAWTLSHLELDS